MAREFLVWLAGAPGSRWLDVGCGTGLLSRVILEATSPSKVVGIDPSAEYIAYAKDYVPGSHVRFVVCDAHDLPVPASSWEPTSGTTPAGWS